MNTLLMRYLLKELFQTFTLCVISLLTLVVMARVVHMRELFLGLDLQWQDAILLFSYMIPSFLLVVLPISCMVSVFLTILRMSTDRELVALKAGGISILQLLGAPALFSFLCFLMALVISLHGIAWGMGSFRSLVMQIASTRAKVVIQPGVFNKDLFAGITLFARQVDPETGRLRQIVFEDTTQSGSSSVTVLAPEGEMITDETNGLFMFRLENGRIYRAAGSNISILEFEEYVINMDFASILTGFTLGEVKPKEMSWNSLRLLLPGSTTREFNLYKKAMVEVQKRLALPFACLVLGIFALPLGCSFEGARQQVGIVFSLGLFLVYYSVFSFGMSMGEAGKIPPVIGLWLANVIFAVATGVGLYFTAKERLFSLNSVIETLVARVRPKKSVA